MMQKWSSSRRRTYSSNLPLLALIFCAFLVGSVLYSERNIQQIHSHHRTEEEQHQQLSITHTSTPTSLPHNISSESDRQRSTDNVDRFTKCSSTRVYSGRKTRIRHTVTDLHRGKSEVDECDAFSGKWVYDVSYPLYNESDCPYMSDQLACKKHGRLDSDYQKWRWQPHNCNLKRWNTTEMWEKLRGKRLMFVGDSLNRGQWISMVCLLQSVIPTDKRTMSPNAALTIFRAEDYNATVEFYWAPLLVESNSDDPVNHRLDDRIIRPDSVLKHAVEWEKADILVFNTYLWWRQGPVKLLWSAEENGVCEELDGLGAMELAMETWADWVNTKVDHRRKKVFFVTMSPTHLWSWEWEAESKGNCFGQKTPIDMENYWGTGSDMPTMRMVEKVLGRLSSKVSVLNITQLSEYRKDGHPSIYRKFWETFSPQQLSNPSSYSDCIHWCLPGVPDVWNELLFNFL